MKTILIFTGLILALAIGRYSSSPDVPPMLVEAEKLSFTSCNNEQPLAAVENSGIVFIGLNFTNKDNTQRRTKLQFFDKQLLHFWQNVIPLNCVYRFFEKSTSLFMLNNSFWSLWKVFRC